MSKPYKGLSHITAPLSDLGEGDHTVLFDLWTIESILNKFGKTQGEFVKTYFKTRT